LTSHFQFLHLEFRKERDPEEIYVKHALKKILSILLAG
jgi:hypothetical protein